MELNKIISCRKGKMIDLILIFQLVVQILLVIKLVVVKFMSPNLILLLTPSEGSSFECLMPLLYKRMHDPNWEIRDSCVEAVTVFAELADTSKFYH